MAENDPGTPARARREAARPRAGWIGLGATVLLLGGYLAYRQVTVAPGTAQTIVVSRGGAATRVIGPGQWGWFNPFREGRTTYDMAILVTDRSAPDRGMPAMSAEGHVLTVFGTAFWREGDEADLRWRFSHIRAGTDLLTPLMAASVQAVMGRHAMEDIVRRAPDVGAELTADLRARARQLLRVDVTGFAITRVDPGESYRAVVSERELGRARAASVAASPAVMTDSPVALEVERIRRWDGRGIIPEREGR